MIVFVENKFGESASAANRELSLRYKDYTSEIGSFRFEPFEAVGVPSSVKSNDRIAPAHGAPVQKDQYTPTPAVAALAITSVFLLVTLWKVIDLTIELPVWGNV